jgi:predicted ester cyclase
VGRDRISAAGVHGDPASGQTIRVEGMNFYRLNDGRVTDIWTQFDGVALMQQLGAIPA